MMPRLLLAATGTDTAEVVPIIDFSTALLLVMVVCLAFMAKALADLSRQVGKLTAARGAPAQAAAVIPAAPKAIPLETIAVISAAVYATTAHPVRVIAVNEAASDQSRTWSLEGRRQIFTSHRVR